MLFFALVLILVLLRAVYPRDGGVLWVKGRLD
jgi:hypothetical protein